MVSKITEQRRLASAETAFTLLALPAAQPSIAKKKS